jgi:hypothetical protein
MGQQTRSIFEIICRRVTTISAMPSFENRRMRQAPKLTERDETTEGEMKKQVFLDDEAP